MASPYDFMIDPSASAQAAALEKLMRQRKMMGLVGQLSGDRVLAPFGRQMASDVDAERESQAQTAHQQIGRLLQAQGLARQQAADAQAQARWEADYRLRSQQAGQDSISAIADPVTGGIILYNKRTGQVRPLGPGGGQPEPGPSGKPPPLLPGKPSEAQRKAVAGASEAISQLDQTIEAVKAAPDAYGGAGNFVASLAEQAGGTPVQSLTARRYDQKELRAKNLVSNVVSKIINDRAGANVTLREELRQKFLPQDTDSHEQALQKLYDLRDFTATTYESQSGGALEAPPAAPSGPVRVKSKAERDALPPGTEYIGPDGKKYTKG